MTGVQTCALPILTRRQRADGGIGLWSATDWTTPWLSAYAGSVLLDAKAAGLAVDDSVLARLEAMVGQRTRLYAWAWRLAIAGGLGFALLVALATLH